MIFFQICWAGDGQEVQKRDVGQAMINKEEEKHKKYVFFGIYWSGDGQIEC